MQALGITLPAVRGQSGAHGLAVRWLAERSGRGRERQGARAGATSDQPTYRRPSAAHSLTARTRHTAMSAASTAQQPRRQRRGGTSQPRRHQASTTSHKVRNASAATELFNCRYDLIHFIIIIAYNNNTTMDMLSSFHGHYNSRLHVFPLMHVEQR